MSLSTKERNAQILVSDASYADLQRWLADGTIARHREPVEVQPGIMIVNGVKYVRRALAIIDAGDPPTAVVDRLDVYCNVLRRHIP